MSDLQHAMGRRLCHYRKKAGLTQAALAKKANCDRATIANLETNRQGCSIAMLAAIAGALGLPVTALFDENVPVVPRIRVRHTCLTECDECGVLTKGMPRAKAEQVKAEHTAWHEKGCP